MKNLFVQKFACFSFVFVIFCVSISAQTAKFSSSGKRKPTDTIIQKLERDIPDLIKKADVAGISAALIRDGKIVWVKSFGFSNAETKEPVTNWTIFEAASLSKVVFAYGVLKLVDEGKLDLDVPLNKYLGNNYEVGDDARINLITARHVLSHSAGFPNWRSGENTKLPINFTPGEKFSYSGEGFVYLSAVLEKITNQKLEDYMKTKVFEPLQMTNSSFLWQDRYEKNGAYRHDLLGNKLFRNQSKNYNAAASLRTTAEDYARFVNALLNRKGLKKKTLDEMFKPQIKVNEKSPQVFWGLGVGIEKTDEGESIWHWGDQGDSKAYFTAFLPKKEAIIYFANSANGLSITKEILDDAIGGTHPAIEYLDYPKYDKDKSRFLLKSIVEKGAVESLKDYRAKVQQDEKSKIGEYGINRIGYALLKLKKIDEAIEIFKLNAADFPDSANVWDSLAEGFMNKGDNENAIKYYEKSLALNPNNRNAAEQLKKLKK